mmetsp:Transcript_8900/g.15700  ORF Transcript_8900/g.15700 Transcript_8900/m.15700 type:complete len:93 (+) Transcript_8900:188-466(+)
MPAGILFTKGQVSISDRYHTSHRKAVTSKARLPEKLSKGQHRFFRETRHRHLSKSLHGTLPSNAFSLPLRRKIPSASETVRHVLAQVPLPCP